MILADVSVVNVYIVHELNGLDSYALCTVHEQDSVVARYEWLNYMCAIAHMVYST